MKTALMALVLLSLLVGRVGAVQLPSAVVTDGLGVNIHFTIGAADCPRPRYDPGRRLQVRPNGLYLEPDRDHGGSVQLCGLRIHCTMPVRLAASAYCTSWITAIVFMAPIPLQRHGSKASPILPRRRPLTIKGDGNI